MNLLQVKKEMQEVMKIRRYWSTTDIERSFLDINSLDAWVVKGSINFGCFSEGDSLWIYVEQVSPYPSKLMFRFLKSCRFNLSTYRFRTNDTNVCNSTCITSANLERFIVHECVWREEDSINLHNFNGKCVFVASFLSWNTFLVGFPLETHNGRCTASQSMHAARQLRAEPTLLEFACGSSFSQDTRSLAARRLLHRLVNLYLLTS